jgi:hypothetical protein
MKDQPAIAVRLEVWAEMITVNVQTCKAFLSEWELERVRRWYCKNYAMEPEHVRVVGQSALVLFDGDLDKPTIGELIAAGEKKAD